jgi:hypothetical protein
LALLLDVSDEVEELVIHLSNALLSKIIRFTTELASTGKTFFRLRKFPPSILLSIYNLCVTEEDQNSFREAVRLGMIEDRALGWFGE